MRGSRTVHCTPRAWAIVIYVTLILRARAHGGAPPSGPFIRIANIVSEIPISDRARINDDGSPRHRRRIASA